MNLAGVIWLVTDIKTFHLLEIQTISYYKHNHAKEMMYPFHLKGENEALQSVRSVCKQSIPQHNA